MRCPKCGYISFDYSQVCSRCNKDISIEQEKLNVPPFRPNPPSLLGALTGEANESQVGIRMDESGGYGTGDHEAGIAMDDSSAIGGDEIAFAESQEMDMGLETEASGEFDATGETGEGADEFSEDFSFDEPLGDDLAMDTGEIALGEAGAPTAPAVEEEDLGLDFDAVSDEAPAALEDLGDEGTPGLEEAELDLEALPDEAPAALEDLGDEGTPGLEEAELDLEALPEEAPAALEDLGGEGTGAELDLDLEGLPDEALSGLEEAAEETGQEEMAADLDLDALGGEAEGLEAGLDLELDSIALDDMAETGEPEAAPDVEGAELDLDRSGLEMDSAAIEEEQGQIELNIDDLKISENGDLEIGADAVPSEEAETSFDMDELSLDEAQPGDTGAALDLDVGADTSSIDLDEIGLGDESVLDSAKAELEGEELIDLDDLDIELDLGEPDDKST